MKQIFALFLISVLLISCSNMRMVNVIYGKASHWTEMKKEEVPVIVLDEFSEKFVNITPEKWYQLPRNHFGVSFQRNGRLNLAVFSSKGNLQNEEYDFREDDYYDEFDDYWDFDIFD